MLAKSFANMVEHKASALAAEKVAAGDLEPEDSGEVGKGCPRQEPPRRGDHAQRPDRQHGKLHEEQKAGTSSLHPRRAFPGRLRAGGEQRQPVGKTACGQYPENSRHYRLIRRRNFSPILEKLPGKQIIANEKMDLLRGNLLKVIDSMDTLHREQKAGDYEYFIPVNSSGALQANGGRS